MTRFDSTDLRSRRFVLRLVLSAAFAAMATAAPARAGLVTHAQFQEKSPDGRFVYTNNGTGATFRTVAGGAPVLFSYSNIAGLPAELAGTQDAHLVLDLQTTDHAATFFNTDFQPFGIAGTLTITRDAPASAGLGSHTLLLGVTFTGMLSGADQGRTGNFSGQSRFDTVVFTSDFLDFGATTDRTASLALNSILTSLIRQGDFLTNFRADATGSFADDGRPVPIAAPEPSTFLMGGLAGALALLGRGASMLRARRRAAAA